MRNLLKGVSLSVSLGLLLTACGGSGSGETAGTPEATAKPQEPLVIKGMANLYQQAPAKDSEFWKTMEKTFNVNYSVDWVPGDNYQQKVDLVLASNDLPDIMQITNTTAPSFLKAVKAGAFWDLTPYLGDFSKYPNFKEYTNKNAWVLSKIGGKNYIVPRTRGNLDVAMFIRQDWLTKLNLKAPTTLDEFTEVMKVISDTKLTVV